LNFNSGENREQGGFLKPAALRGKSTKGEQKMKYTKQQQISVNAGMTLCVECVAGWNGDKSCGSNGMIKLPKTSTNGCFCGKKIAGFKGEPCLR
jgi:hypothetical protein